MRRIKDLAKANALVLGMLGFIGLLVGLSLYLAYPDKKWAWV